MNELLMATLEALDPILATDPDGEKYPELWAIHADICQTIYP